jgi:hypothetical protein
MYSVMDAMQNLKQVIYELWTLEMYTVIDAMQNTKQRLYFFLLSIKISPLLSWKKLFIVWWTATMLNWSQRHINLCLL